MTLTPFSAGSDCANWQQSIGIIADGSEAVQRHVYEPAPGKGVGAPLNNARPALPEEIPGGTAAAVGTNAFLNLLPRFPSLPMIMLVPTQNPTYLQDPRGLSVNGVRYA